MRANSDDIENSILTDELLCTSTETLWSKPTLPLRPKVNGAFSVGVGVNSVVREDSFTRELVLTCAADSDMRGIKKKSSKLLVRNRVFSIGENSSLLRELLCIVDPFVQIKIDTDKNGKFLYVSIEGNARKVNLLRKDCWRKDSLVQRVLVNARFSRCLCTA